MILAPLSRSALRVGSEARIRPSSVIVCPSSGTLRSQRMSTRLPARSPRSETDFTLDPFPSKDRRVDTPGGSFAQVSDGLHMLQPMQSVGFRRERRKPTYPDDDVGLQRLTDQADQVDEAAGVAPLVVVPA